MASPPEERTSSPDVTTLDFWRIGDACDGALFVVDPDTDTFVYCNQAAAELLGYGRDELTSLGPADVHPHDVNAFDSFVDRVLEHGTASADRIKYHAERTVVPASVTGTRVRIDGRPYVLVIAQDSGDTGRDTRVPGEFVDDPIETLHAVSRSLARADTPSDVARSGLDAAVEALGTAVGCIRRYDQTADELEVVYMTDPAAELVEERAAFDLELTFAARAYRDAETVVSPAGQGATPDQATVHAPLGGYGVLTLFAPPGTEVSDADRQLVEAIAADVSAHLDRAQHERELREHRRTVDQQRDELDTLNRVGRLIQTLIRDLTRADTREEIAEGVCRRLASSERYEHAWIGELTADDGIAVTASSGVDDTRVEEISAAPEGAIANGVVERAIRSERVQVVSERYTVDSGRETPDQKTAATAAVPLAYGERVYGVLTVVADREDAFGSEVRSGLETLGNAIGFAVSALENEELLLSDELVELEFEVTDPDCLAVAISEPLGCECQVEQSVMTDDGEYIFYVRVRDTTAEEARETILGIDHVSDCTVVSDLGNEAVLEVKRGYSGAEVMMEFGATVRTASAVDGVGTLVVEAPRSVEVREIVNAYQEMNPRSELVAKREVNRPVQSATKFRETLYDRLTEKQESALVAAFSSGYYEWPRERTAEEIASSLGVSSATFHQHVRTAERKLLSAFLERDADEVV